MQAAQQNNKTPNEVYVQRYKEFIRLLKISKMLKQAKIVVHSKQK